MSPLPKDVQERLDKAREARTKREERDALLGAELEIQKEELIAKYEAEGQKNGVDFLVFETNAGIIAVKRGEVLTYQRFVNSPGERPTETQLYDFAKPNVLFPDGPTFDRMKDQHGNVLALTVAALRTLHGVRIQRERGE